MRLIDLTRQSMGWSQPFQTRAMNQITRIAIHHSASVNGSQMIFENHWRNLGWRNGGYSEIILPNGDVEICYAPTVVTNGVMGHNLDTYNICVVGNFRINGAQPSATQMRSLLERIRFNASRFNVASHRVLGHNEFPNNPTICPGQDMNNLRQQLQVPKVAPATSGNQLSTHTVRAGETLFGIARQHGTTVAELERLNNMGNVNLIRPGQVLRLSATGTTPETNRYQVTRATPGFFTAADAAAGRNPRTSVRPGTYYVFNRSSGMLNVTSKLGHPGSWINPNH